MRKSFFYSDDTYFFENSLRDSSANISMSFLCAFVNAHNIACCLILLLLYGYGCVEQTLFRY